MADKVLISSIKLTSATKSKVFNRKEIEQFCAQKLKVTVTEDCHQNKNVKCRVILDRLSADYIEDALNGKNTKEKRQCTVKPVPKVNIFFFEFCNLQIHFVISKNADKSLLYFSRLQRKSFVNPEAKKIWRY